MSLIHPAGDTRYIIQQAMNNKSLGQLAKEEEAYQAKLAKERKGITESNLEENPPKVLVTKEDLQAFKKECENKTADEIFEKLGIEVKYDNKGNKSISHYKWPFQAFSFKLAGIDEAKLLEGVTAIEHKCDLTGSSLKNLGSVKQIGWDLIIPFFSKVQDLSSIEKIGGSIICETENPNDAIKKIKEINLNPQYIGGCINPHDMYQMYGIAALTTFPKDLQEAIKYLQGK